MKKILNKIFLLFAFMFWFFNQTSAKWSDYINITWNWWSQSLGWKSEAPTIKAWWLPGNSGEGNMEKILVNFTDFFIWIIAVIAVLALIISWIMYMLSGWEPEKAKKATIKGANKVQNATAKGMKKAAEKMQASADKTIEKTNKELAKDCKCKCCEKCNCGCECCKKKEDDCKKGCKVEIEE